MKAIPLILIAGLFMGCSVSKKLIEKKEETRNESTASHLKEVITEPLISYIEVPVDCPDLKEKPSPPKIYEIRSGPTHIKARLHGNTLRINTENKGQNSKENVIVFSKLNNKQYISQRIQKELNKYV